MEIPGNRSTRLGLAVLLAVVVFLGAWFWTSDASLTHDEVVYLDIAEHPFSSDFYPGETFLRHPPLGLALLSGWVGLSLPVKAWPLPWVLGGLGLLAGAIGAREGSPAWLAVPVLSSPAIVPLVTVTLYPPLFFFLSLAAWGWATRRRYAELVGWNLAVFTHELALLVLALVLVPRALRRIREGVTRLGPWARLVLPYPAALAWGSVMVWNLLAGTDARGGWVSQALLDPSPNLAAILGLKPLVGLVLLVALVPLLVRPDRDPEPSSRALTAASVIAIVAAPFYRYALAVIPLLVVLRADRPPGWWRRFGAWGLVAACLAASGMGLGATVTGVDTLNAAALPGLVDHNEAEVLVEPGEHVVVRSPLSFAHALEDEGWRLASTAPTGPATVTLERDGETITFHRVETLAGVQGVEQADALLFPASWRNVPADLPGEGWTRTGAAGSMERWEPAPGSSTP